MRLVRHVARALLPAVAGALAGTHPAAGQAVGTAGIQSDALLRGRSLSDGRPVASLGLSQDWRSGAYGGIELLATLTRADELRFLGVTTQLGYARRLNPKLAVDGGLIHRAYSSAYTPGVSARFAEAYAGVSGGPLSARVAFAPDYFNRGVPTLYFEAEMVRRIADATRATIRGGVLAVLGDTGPPRPLRSRWDVRAGLAHDLGQVTLDGAVHATGSDPDRLSDNAERRVTATLGARLAF